MNNNKNKIIILSGTSGSGKTTIENLILNEFKNVMACKTYTTREPRPNETAYNFVSKDDFQKLIDSGKLLEYTNYCGNFYGTSLEFLESSIKNSNVILILDFHGKEALEEKFGSEKIISIFIDSENNLKRLKNRGEANETISFRLNPELIKIEKEHFKNYKYIVKNDSKVILLA